MKQESKIFNGIISCILCEFKTKRSIFLSRHLSKKHKFQSNNNCTNNIDNNNNSNNKNTAATPQSVKSYTSENNFVTSKSAKMQRSALKSKKSVATRKLRLIREKKISSGIKFKHECRICHDKFVDKSFLARHAKVVHQIIRQQKDSATKHKKLKIDEPETPTGEVLIKPFQNIMKKGCNRKLF